MARRRYQHPRVQKSASTDKAKQYWWFRARVDVIEGAGKIGRREKTFELGFCSEMGKREAELRRDEILSKAINRPDVILTSQVKFGIVISAFLSQLENSEEVRRHSILSMRNLVEKHFVPAFGDLRICDIDHAVVQAWLYGLPLAWATRKKAKTVFGAIWKMARRLKYTTDVSPSEDASPGKKTGIREKTLPTVQQFKGMLAVLTEPFRSITVLATFTGLRISEIRALRWSAFLSRNDFLIIERSRSCFNEEHDPKTRKSKRAIPVGNLKASILSLMPVGADPSGLVFPSSYNQILDHIKSAGKKVGLDYDGFGCHTLRRLHNTWFRRGGAAVEVAMQQLGHTSSEMNDLYFIESQEDLKTRSALVDQMFQRVMFSAEESSKLQNSAGRMWDEGQKPQ